MSPKLLAGLGEPLHYHSLLDGALLDGEGISGGSQSSLDISDCCHSNSCGGSHKRTGGHSCSRSFCFESGCVRDGVERGGSVRGEGGGRGGEGGEKKKKRGGIKPGAVRSPAASSPVRRCLHYICAYIYACNWI